MKTNRQKAWLSTKERRINIGYMRLLMAILFRATCVLLLINAVVAHAIPLSILLEQERVNIEGAIKLHQNECASGTTSQACSEQRDALIKALNVLISDATEESDTEMPEMRKRALKLIAWAREQLAKVK
jgi:hypothetical protein